jgi:hypothetical protein
MQISQDLLGALHEGPPSGQNFPRSGLAGHARKFRSRHCRPHSALPRRPILLFSRKTDTSCRQNLQIFGVRRSLNPLKKPCLACHLTVRLAMPQIRATWWTNNGLSGGAIQCRYTSCDLERNIRTSPFVSRREECSLDRAMGSKRTRDWSASSPSSETGPPSEPDPAWREDGRSRYTRRNFFRRGYVLA